MSANNVRTRFGVRHNLKIGPFPVFQNALIGVVYLSPDRFQALQQAVHTISTILSMAWPMPPIALVCEASEA